MAAAQPAERVHRVGILRPGSRPRSDADIQVAGISKALAGLGYVEGRNLTVDLRFADGDIARMHAFAQEMVAARADVLVAVGVSAIRAARAATPPVPIVMFGNFDPIALGLVTDLARPGGHLTGVLIAPDGTLAGKRVELLKAAVPQATRIALLSPSDPDFRTQAQETRLNANALGLTLQAFVVTGSDYEAAFAAMAAFRADAVVVGGHQYFVRDRKQIIELAARHRLPAIYEWREQVQDGGLMAYSTSLSALHLRVASHVDRILKGTRPGDIPIEQPTRFELVVNTKTARALGLSLSPSFRLQIDEVVD